MSVELLFFCSRRREEARKRKAWFEPPHVGCGRALALALVFFARTANAATNDFFAQGVALDRAGYFSEAAAAFENSLKQNPSAGALANLGLTEWQRGHAGAAILAWERAQWIDPFDERTKQNLKFARTAAQVEEPELRWHETISTWLPPAAWAWIAGAGLWLALGALVLPRFFRWKKSGGQQTVAALGVMVFIVALTANVGVVGRTGLGVVVKKNAPLRLTPTREGEVISTLNAGEAARKIKTRGNFYFIRTAMGAGWVAKENFGLVVEK